VHDHTVWGLVGVLRGQERCDEFDLQGGQPVANGRSHVMTARQIEAVSPTLGDWHRVSNARSDGPSVSIHVYGGNIGAVRRHRLDDQGRVIDFVSGYSAATVPNLWDLSAGVR
jgi:predicted metal-dependent enzyme (double-stranded beta helix superfamily)